MKTKHYQAPSVEVSDLFDAHVLCASNEGGSEDFGKGTGFSFDLFESSKPL